MVPDSPWESRVRSGQGRWKQCRGRSARPRARNLRAGLAGRRGQRRRGSGRWRWRGGPRPRPVAPPPRRPGSRRATALGNDLSGGEARTACPSSGLRARGRGAGAAGGSRRSRQLSSPREGRSGSCPGLETPKVLSFGHGGGTECGEETPKGTTSGGHVTSLPSLRKDPEWSSGLSGSPERAGPSFCHSRGQFN